MSDALQEPTRTKLVEVPTKTVVLNDHEKWCRGPVILTVQGVVCGMAVAADEQYRQPLGAVGLAMTRIAGKDHEPREGYSARKPVGSLGQLRFVQVIRTRLRQAGENASWTTLCRILEGQQRITATFRRADGRTLYVRKATRAEPPQQAIYDALGIGSAPGRTHKTVV